MATENSRKRAPLFESRLATYGAAAAAALAGAAAPNAEGAVIKFTPAPAPATGVNGFVFFNLPAGTTVTGGTASVGTGMTFGLSQGTVIGLSSSRGASAFAGPLGGQIAGSSSSITLALRLGAGALIDGARSFFNAALLLSSFSNSFSSGAYGNWLGGGRGFLGLVFNIGANTHYGWADISVNASTFAVTLNCFAYEDQPNTGITTPSGDACAADTGGTTGGTTGGEIPEPHSAALLAMGAAGLTAYRRRRQRVA